MADNRYGRTSNGSRGGTAAHCEVSEPACSACGQLSCLCRPRFFAGQLLTEADLNRLDRYIVEKNRLRNRHLHDWGTVNGLEVSCEPCGDSVRVSPGYAIDRCGNDIVVPAVDSVDVCELIAACKQRERKRVDCRPYAVRSDCKDVQEEWILAIRYRERPSRGVTPLSGRSPCSCQSTSSGCTCNGKAGAGSQRQMRRGAPATCEPTILCESYVYEVFKKPIAAVDSKADGAAIRLDGPMLDRFNCCVDALLAIIPAVPTQLGRDHYDRERAAWYRWVCATRRALLDHLGRYPGFHCTRAQDLQSIACPHPDSRDFVALIEVAITRLLTVAFQIVLDCLCAALLPPIPESTDDTRVALASITVRARDCKVVEVCNWTPMRKVAITVPNLRYWLSWLPLTDAIRELFHRLCCDRLVISKPSPDAPVPGDTAPAGEVTAPYLAAPKFEKSASIAAFTRMASNAVARTAPGLDAAGFMANALGREFDQRPAVLDQVERRNLSQALLLERVAGPMLEATGIGGMAKELASVVGNRPRSEESEEVSALRQQLSALGKRLTAQEQRIAQLEAALAAER